MLRSFLSIISGLLGAAIVVGLVGMLGYAVYPPPFGIEVHDMQTLKILIGFASFGIFLFIIASWVLGSFAGGFAAGLIATQAKLKHALLVGVILMAFGVTIMVMFAPPAWFWVLGLLSFIPFAYAGARVSSMNRKPQ